jgi:hypothetical protein
MPGYCTAAPQNDYRCGAVTITIDLLASTPPPQLYSHKHDSPPSYTRYCCTRVSILHTTDGTFVIDVAAYLAYWTSSYISSPSPLQLLHNVDLIDLEPLMRLLHPGSTILSILMTAVSQPRLRLLVSSMLLLGYTADHHRNRKLPPAFSIKLPLCPSLPPSFQFLWREF